MSDKYTKNLPIRLKVKIMRKEFPRLKITKDPSTWDIGKLT